MLENNWRAFRKALAPVVVGALAALQGWAASEDFDSTELRYLAVTAIASVVTYLVPNADFVVGDR